MCKKQYKHNFEGNHPTDGPRCGHDSVTRSKQVVGSQGGVVHRLLAQFEAPPRHVHKQEDICNKNGTIVGTSYLARIGDRRHDMFTLEKFLREERSVHQMAG